ncbi:MAG TPA: alcohol dehydrogenase catalytic domain-containing protein [Dehalococcoidia bacterium]|nr:alcohol dehydrogenase catalytic domain-containing protein [Dehalococcoidia bacterium]
MTEKSLAAVLVAPECFELRELDLPEVGDDAALLKVEACGICGSDISGSKRLPEGPKILGHENVGVIARIGRGAAARWRLREGDRVALEEYVPCGACKWCRSDDFRFCDQTDRNGSLRYGTTPISTAPALWGGYSEYLYVHPGAVIHRMPSQIPAPHAAMFLPLSNGIEWAYEYGEVRLGDAVLVQGPGQQGLACAFAAKRAGAGCVIVTGLSRDAKRLEIARKLGADHVIDVEHENVVSKVMDYTGGEGVNVVVNVTGGGKGTVAQAVSVAAKRCNVVLAAAGSETVDVAGFGRRKLTLKQANGHSYGSVERAIEFLAAGLLPMDEIATHTFGLGDAMQAIDTVAGKSGEGIHVSIIPGL